MTSATAQKIDAADSEQWQQMTLEEAIEVAHRETGISYQKDDPILAVVSILNAFGDRLKGLLEDERNRVADNQHPDHQFRIDRWAASGTVKRSQMLAKICQINKPVNRP